MNKLPSSRPATPEELTRRRESLDELAQKLAIAGYIPPEQQQPLAEKLFTQFFGDSSSIPAAEQLHTLTLTTELDKSTTVLSAINVVSYPDTTAVEVQWLRCSMDNITKDISPVFDTHLPSIQAVAILLKETQAIHKRLATQHHKHKAGNTNPLITTTGHKNNNTTKRWIDQLPENRNTPFRKRR
ncbi:hypothetical protein HNQ91_000706 [Filimonas zeae]|uniref:Uncharacterized protein n=1 Tax=Filimonas zeae TaxID=1737353 RepID=A0A917IQJ5_9BACT|nr:hypothetical protein [Filimonas zeae]MDR6337684.1 hypothetical protein [Filimonas zeae]GGH59773.1 hypothetical protein GCM10011379_06920 [Filimonas zeae]